MRFCERNIHTHTHTYKWQNQWWMEIHQKCRIKRYKTVEKFLDIICLNRVSIYLKCTHMNCVHIKFILFIM